MIERIGKLQRVPLRDVWGSESLGKARKVAKTIYCKTSSVVN